MNIAVITGWYSTKSTRTYTTFGDEKIRSLSFRGLWNTSVENALKPESISIIDSASPVKLDVLKEDSKVQIINLAHNLGHARESVNLLCGYTIGVLTGLIIQYSSKADFIVYVEQDTLIYGDLRGYINALPRNIKYQFGSGVGCPQPLQVSLMIFRREDILEFCSNVLSLNYKDSVISPELKFLYASTRGLGKFILNILIKLSIREFSLLARISRKLIGLFSRHLYPASQLLRFGYGRTRPINFSDELFHFQHSTESELSLYRKKINDLDVPELAP
jgi:hypothetical protein